MRRRGRRVLGVLLVIVLLGVLCALGLIGFVYYQETHLPPVQESDVIIVLGAQVKADGTPSVALTRRLTAALESYREKRQIIIVCGAQGGNEPRAEGDVMRFCSASRNVMRRSGMRISSGMPGKPAPVPTSMTRASGARSPCASGAALSRSCRSTRSSSSSTAVRSIRALYASRIAWNASKRSIARWSKGM